MPDEWESSIEEAAHDQSYMTITGKLCASATVDDFEKLGEDIPSYESCYDDSITTQALNEEEDSIQVRRQLLDSIHEVNDNYLHAEVMLPKGNSYSQDKVIRREWNVDGNLI